MQIGVLDDDRCMSVYGAVPKEVRGQQLVLSMNKNGVYISLRYNVPQKVTRSFAAYADYFPGTPKRGHEIWNRLTRDRVIS